MRLGNLPIASTKTTLKTGLVGWWLMDKIVGGKVQDLSGNGHDATVVGDVEDGHRGLHGGSLYFPGTNDRLVVAHTAKLAITGSITISYWVNIDKGETGDQMVLSKSAGFEPGGYQSYMNGGLEGYGMRFGRGNDLPDPDDSSERRNCDLLNHTGVWANYSVSCTSVGDVHTLRFFINGVFSNEDVFTEPVIDRGNDLWIGESPGGSRDFNGHLADLRIWNRALTDTEMEIVYNDINYNIRPALKLKLNDVDETNRLLDNAYRSSEVLINSTEPEDMVGHPGIFGNDLCFKFDNNDDFLSIIPSTTIFDCLLGDFTFLGWFNTTAGSVTNEVLIAQAKDDGDITPAPISIEVNTNDVLTMRFGDGIDSTTSTGTSLVTRGRWEHIAVVVSGTSVYFYINTVLDASGAITNTKTRAFGEQELRIGIRQLARDFGGFMDHLELHPSAWSQDSIQEDYNETDSLGSYGDLECWYKLNEESGTVAEDYSKNHNNLNISSGVTINQPGQIYKSYEMDGSVNSVVQATGLSGLPAIGTGDYTISLWMKINGTPADSTQSLLAFGGFSNGLVLRYIVSGEGTTGYFSMSENTRGENSPSRAGLNDNVWHHVCVIRYNGLISYHIDNVLEGTDESDDGSGDTNDITVAPTLIELGRNGAGNQELDGWIDDVRFYSKALTNYQIQQLSEMSEP
jgi:hypothetical protein